MSDREIIFQRWGWVLFTISALFYIVSSIESRSLTGLAGSLFFLIACVLFMIPLFTMKE